MNIELDKIQNILDWIKKKILLDALSDKAKKRNVKRGQVYRCNFGYGIGSEMQKERPAVVVQNDVGNNRSGNTIVLPITHDSSNLPCVTNVTTQLKNDGSVLLDGQANAPLYNYVISSSSITASYNLDEFEMRVKAVDNNLSLYKDKNYIAVYPMKFYIEALVQSVSKQLNAKATVDKEKLRQDVTAVWNKIMNCKRNCFSTDEKILFQIIKMKNLNLIVLYINLRNFMKKVLYSVKGNIYR